jgi:hypothetical protein
MKFMKIFVVRFLSSNVISNNKHALFNTVTYDGLTQTQKQLTGHKDKHAITYRDELCIIYHGNSPVIDSVHA